MQEILPLKPTGPEELISPAVFGELSRRLPSLFAVQNRFPRRNGLVGDSRILLSSVSVAEGDGQLPAGWQEFLSPVFRFTGFRKTSAATPFPKIAIAFRSLTEAQIFPFWSKAMPSTPSRRGSARKMWFRQSVLSRNVSSQPRWLLRVPSVLNFTCHSAPLAVSATKRSPSRLNASPLATSG